MEFLRLFDLIEFDQNGNVCASKKCDKNQSRSNYLYLLSKYNQRLLKDANLKIPDFFKNDLSEVLKSVENGGDFEKAKETVLYNCLLQVQFFAEKSDSDKALLQKVNNSVVIKDCLFAEKQKSIVNNLQLSYIITALLGKVEEKIENSIANDMRDQNSKKELFRNVVKYNGLFSTADKVAKNELNLSDFEQSIG